MIDFEAAVSGILTDAEVARLSAKTYSDVKDAQNHQYVDLVMEGGGMLGFALLGYTYALEKCGVRFWSIAGTSAGAITALFMAGLGKKQDPKSVKVAEHLNSIDTSSFLDGDGEVKKVIEGWQDGTLDFHKFLKCVCTSDSFSELLDGFSIIDRDWLAAYKANGLFKGDVFRLWVAKCLRTAEVPVNTLADLDALMTQQPPGLRLDPDPRRTADIKDLQSSLALVAAEVTTETIAIFPRMASLYWADPSTINPAEFVRASMGIPFFFEPYRVSKIPMAGQPINEAWKATGYEGKIPEEVAFVDGGIVSNFPIAVFHSKDQIPTHPTFGVKLDRDRTSPRKTSNPAEMAAAIFDCSRHSLDNDFLLKNPDYRHLVAFIDTLKINWLDFKMSPEDKTRLFVQGANEAVKFLDTFDWAKYKDLRESLLNLPSMPSSKQLVGT